MPILKRWIFDEALWGIWKVTESPEELRSFLTEKSCDEEELASLKAYSRRMEYLAVRVLVKELTGTESMISHYESGKPYLVDGSFMITISHTKGYVAVGLHKSGEVGIDIEYCSDRVRKVFSRFVNVEEMRFLPLSDTVEGTKAYVRSLLLIWSAKETIYKMMNKTEVDFLRHIRICPFCIASGSDIEGTLYAYENKSENLVRYELGFMINDDFVCTYSRSIV